MSHRINPPPPAASGGLSFDDLCAGAIGEWDDARQSKPSGFIILLCGLRLEQRLGFGHHLDNDLADRLDSLDGACTGAEGKPISSQSPSVSGVGMTAENFGIGYSWLSESGYMHLIPIEGPGGGLGGFSAGGGVATKEHLLAIERAKVNWQLPLEALT
jgi:hypothetical protein